MKKGLKSLMVTGMVGAASIGLMTGCANNESTSYLEVVGLDTTWIQNQAISIEDAKVLYYESKDDTTPEEVDLQANMINNFHTSLVGENTMTITYKDTTLEVDYNVVSLDTFKGYINTAIDNLKASQCVKAVSSENETDIVEATMYKDGIYYHYEEDFTEWYTEESGTWYHYKKIGNNTPTKLNIGSQFSLVDEIVDRIIGDMPSADEMLSFTAVVSYEFDIENNQTIIIFNMHSQYNDNSGIVQYYIENGKFVKIEYHTLEMSANNHTTATTLISYDADDISIPALPDIAE